MGKKKFVDTGAPAYMAQYTALMTLLLAFFILLNVLSESKESGFKDGIGQIRNAFGQVGGLGIFSYTFSGKGAAHPPAPPVLKNAKKTESGFDKDLVRGDGGQGSTDAKTEKKHNPTYVRYKLYISFEERKSKLTPKIMNKLDQLGVGLASFEDKLEIRCYSLDTGNFEYDRNLAARRAANILIYFNQKLNIPFKNLSASGYGNKRYFQKQLEVDTKTGENVDHNSTQGAYIYVFINKKVK